MGGQQEVTGADTNQPIWCIPADGCQVWHELLPAQCDEYTRAHTAAHTAGQNLDSWIHDRITDALNQSE